MNELFYNRDRNITGLSTLTGLVFAPSYGSSASFTTKMNQFPYPDAVTRRMAPNLNSTVGEYSLIFRERENVAAAIIDYIESLSGVIPAIIQDPSNIYHTISGFVDEFSWTAKTNLEYELTAKVVVDNVSSYLNPTGMSFVDAGLENWQPGSQISRYDIRYFEYDTANKLNNVFYATGDHVSDITNCPFSTGSFWAQDLFFDDALDYSIATQPGVKKLDLSSSFTQRIKDEKNIHAIKGVTLSYPNISDRQAKTLLHFAESKFGTTRFKYQVPKIYNRPKIFTCPSWRHTWNYKNSNTVELDLIEEPLGILQNNDLPVIQLTQDGGQASLDYSFASVNGIGVFNFGGETLLLQNGSGVQIWNDGVGHNVKVYGGVTGFNSSGQRIDSFSTNARSPLKSVSLPDNYMTAAVLNGAKNLNHLNLANNSLSALDLSSMTGLANLNVENNLLAALDVSDCNNLTGLFCSGNRLSYSQVSGILDSLVNDGNYSGILKVADGTYSDVITNSVISGGSFLDAATLSWRSWTVDIDNCVLPFNLSGVCSPVAWYQQESITGYSNGEAIFSWTDSTNSIIVSKNTVIDSERPRYFEGQIGARPILQFSSPASLKSSSGTSVSQPFGVFCAYESSSSSFCPLFVGGNSNGIYFSGGYPGYVNNGSFYTGARPFSNQVNIFGAQIVSSGAYLYNNSTTGEFVAFTPASFTSGYSIGSGSGVFLNGRISEALLATGISSAAQVIQGLGLKHGTNIL